MPTFIDGLPLHVLIVHAVVVLVPLAVLGTVTVAVWPAARRRYGWLVVALTAVATVVIPLATSTGEGLRDHLPRTQLIRQHTELGDQLLVFVAGLFVVSCAFVYVHWRYLDAARVDPSDDPATAASSRRKMDLPGWGRPIALAGGVLTVVLAVVCAVQVYRIGDSGAKAAWNDTPYITPTSHRSAP